MKKKAILFILSLLTLSACAGNEMSQSMSSLSSESSSSESSSSIVEKGWKEEDKKIMKDNLFGEVLPYIDAGEKTTVEFLPALNELHIMGSSVLSRNTLKEYSNLYSKEDGWYDSSNQYQGLPQNVYSFGKVIETKNGKRYINVQFYALDSVSHQIAEDGIFALLAYSPYEYEFPTAMFDEGIQLVSPTSKLHVPEFKADYYKLSYAEYEIYEVICFTTDTHAEATYKKSLEENKFILLGEKNDYGDYIAVSSDYQFAVCFYYDEEYGTLDIYLSNVPESITPNWPKEGLKEAFTTYGQEAFDIPKMKFEGALYSAHESDMNYYYAYFGEFDKINYTIEVIGANQEHFNQYVTQLSTDKWNEDKKASEEIGEGTKVFTKEINGKTAKIDVGLGSNLVVIHVYLYTQKAPSKVWPSEDIKMALHNEYIDDQLPALTSEKATGYVVHEASYDPAYVEILCELNDVDEVFKAYEDLLTQSEWTSYHEKENTYLSPKKELIVEVKKNTSSVSIYFYDAPIKSWPSKFVKKQLENRELTDELPSIEGEKLTFMYYIAPFRYPKSFKIEVIIDQDNDSITAQQLMEKYEKELTEKGFQKNERDDTNLDNESIYDSPQKQYDVSLYISSSDTLSILVTPIVQI